MLTLKQGCTAQNFKNMEKTKDNFVLLIYGTIEKEFLDQAIEQKRQVVSGGFDKTGDAQDRIDYLLKLKTNKNYQEGNLPRGIEKIIMQTMETFSFWHSMNCLDSGFFLLEDNYIHNLMNVSITFMVSCELAKLFNYKPEDFSLKNIWDEVVNDIVVAGITSTDEIDYISEQFRRNEATRDKAIKRFLDFRNKSIDHNSNDIGLKWEDFVKTMNFIVRVWGILDEFYSPNCFPRPIQLSDGLYAPIKRYFKHTEIEKMKAERLSIMKDMFEAASTNLVTRQTDKIKPFFELNMSVKIEIK